MTDINRGKDRRYSGEEVDITYNLKRCIHAEYCVHRLSAVFDKSKRPWIDASGASAGEVATVVEMCPSGALHYERKDGLSEAIPDKNQISVRHNGPLEIRGNLQIVGANLLIEQETRVSLCRCGASNNKPFCDNTHLSTAFEAIELEPDESIDVSYSGGQLTITASTNGPYNLEGNVQIVNEAQETLYSGNKVSLCRCGGSSTKPICDGTHRRNHFVAE